MAREESSREDLLREATALVERIEFVPCNLPADGSAEPSRHEHIVAGFRSNGAFSVFFGDDPVYQFNSAGELRRAFSDGLLFKASHQRLVSIRRVRLENQIQLVTQELAKSEQSEFLSRMSDHLCDLSLMLDAGSFELIGQVPATADVLGRVRAWLAANRSVKIAARPNA